MSTCLDVSMVVFGLDAPSESSRIEMGVSILAHGLASSRLTKDRIFFDQR